MHFRSGERINLIRSFSGLSQEDLASRVYDRLPDIAEMLDERATRYAPTSIRTRLGEWEAGARLPNDHIALAAALALGIDLNTFLTDLEIDRVQYSEREIKEKYSDYRTRIGPTKGTEEDNSMRATPFLKRIYFPYLNPVLSTSRMRSKIQRGIRRLIRQERHEIIISASALILAEDLAHFMNDFPEEIEKGIVLFPLRGKHRDYYDFLDDKKKEHSDLGLGWISEQQEELALSILSRSRDAYRRDSSTQTQKFVEFYMRWIKASSLRRYTDKVRKLMDASRYRNFISVYALKQLIKESFGGKEAKLLNAGLEYGYLHGGGVGNKASFWSSLSNPSHRSRYDLRGYSG